MMPPEDRAPAGRARRARRWSRALETTLDAAAATNPNPGRRVVSATQPRRIHRGRRALFGLDIDVSTLPAGRHDQRRLRQHRRRADAVRDGDAGLHARRGVRQPRRGGRSVARPRARRNTTCRERSRRRTASRARRLARAAAPSSPTTSRPTASTSSSCCCTASRPGCSSAAPCATSRWKSRSTASASRS